jgi:hypothetical protein
MAIKEPNCYYICRTQSGWSARFDHSGYLHHFVSKSRALNAAREAALIRWQFVGKATCVKVEETDGSVTTDSAYGRA